MLKNVSFAAGPGEIAVLVGTSGAGKTTLVRVLLGLVYPESGRAVLRGKNGCEIVISAETRCAFSYVPQGSTLFSGTIAENLCMAKENATEEEMTAALLAAKRREHEDHRARRRAFRGAGAAHRHRPRGAARRADPAP